MKLGRVLEVRRQIIQDQAVCAAIFLVIFHDRREDVFILFLGKGVDRFFRREGLESKFRTEAEVVFFVFCKMFQPVHTSQ